MTDGPGKKLFSAEIQRLKAKGVSPEGNAAPPMDSVLGSIEALRQEMQSLEQTMRQGITETKEAVQARSSPTSDAEIEELKAEIRAMSECIERTKMEIAALRPSNAPDDRLTAVTNELDAIVEATESATEGILESAEKIDGLAQQLETRRDDPFIAHITDELREAVVKVFEESNFQDITGQRINKVVKTLQFIEERVNRMIEIWGKDSFTDLPVAAEMPDDEDKKLLNGPALANEGISQEDIDKLFD